MSISEQIDRIMGLRDDLFKVLQKFGITTNDSRLETITKAFDAIKVQKENIKVLERNEVPIPAGYYDGTTKVIGLTDEIGDKAQLQENKTVTPADFSIVVTPDTDKDYIGLAQVTVNPIPSFYVNASGLSPTDSTKILANQTVIGNIGTEEDPVYGMITGSVGKEQYTATPTKQIQYIIPNAPNLIERVTINPIPEEYIITIPGPEEKGATSLDILEGTVAFINGVKIEGSMKNKSSLSFEVNGMLDEPEIEIPAGYYDGTGKITLSSSVEQALAAI